MRTCLNNDNNWFLTVSGSMVGPFSNLTKLKYDRERNFLLLLFLFEDVSGRIS